MISSPKQLLADIRNTKWFEITLGRLPGKCPREILLLADLHTGSFRKLGFG